MTTAFDFSVRTADGGTQQLADYTGQVLLIVNVASKCGFTPQGLEQLHRDAGPRGLQILGFPSNQFGEQEPGTDTDIQEFCSTTYDVTFPIFAKVDVNGSDADPLYVHLRAEDPGTFGPEAGGLFEHVSRTRPEAVGTDDIKWNFTKFLVGRDGRVIRRYESTVTPEEIRADIEPLLTT